MTGVCQHTSAYVSIRQHTSVYVRIRQQEYVSTLHAMEEQTLVQAEKKFVGGQVEEE